MAYRLLSTETPAPPGFRITTLDGLDLLVSSFALYTRDPEAVLARAEACALSGVLLTPGPVLAGRALGERLWLYTLPVDQLDAAQQWLPPLLQSLARENTQRQIMDLMPQSIIVRDEHDRIILANRAAARHHGRAGVEELIGQSFEATTSGPEEAARAHHFFAQLRENGQPVEHDYLITNPKGESRRLHVRFVPLPSGHGNILSLATDVTEQHEHELALQALNARLSQEQTRLSQIIDMLPQDIVVYDEADCILIGNCAAAKSLGQPSAEVLIGKSVDELFAHDPLRAEQIRQANAEIRRSWQRSTYSTEVPVHAVNGPASFEVIKLPMSTGDGVGILTIVTDVTQRRDYEKELRALNIRLTEQQAELRQIIDLIPENIVVYDESDRIVLGNTVAMSFLHRPGTSALEGQPIAELLDFSPQLAAAIRRTNAQVRAGRQPLRYSVEDRGPDGSLHYYDVCKVPLPTGDQLKVLMVSVDVTERRQHEQELQQLNAALEARVRERTAELDEARQAAESANQAKSLFLATMSHEIRTPMNGVLGLLELLRFSNMGPEQSDMVSTVHESALNLLAILDDILDFSKIEAGRLTLEMLPLDLGSLAQGIVDTLQGSAAAKRLVLRGEIDPHLPPQLMGDPVRLRQVLTNLISNALKFTETTAERAGEIVLGVHLDRTRTDAAYVTLCVRDNGIGMSEAAQARLFQPFTQAESSITRRFGGTGLGLSICRRLVALMGGEITVSSQPGQGTEFQVHLRLRRTASAAAHKARPPQPERRPSSSIEAAEAAGQLVLVVEDNPVNQKVIARQLDWLGYASLLAGDGQQALSVISQRRIGLVLTDCHMPVMDGYALTAQLRQQEATQHRPRLPIIALSANAIAGEAERCLLAGMDDYLAKPVELGTLKTTMEKWLGEAKE